MADTRQQPDTADSLRGNEARRQWTSRVFMEAADPILIEDLEGRVIDMNCEAERAYGLVEGILEKSASSMGEFMTQVRRTLADHEHAADAS